MTQVTDPEVLKKVRAAAAATVRKPVEDPAVIAKVRETVGPAGSGRPSGFLSAFLSGVKRGSYNERANARAALGTVLHPFNAELGDSWIDHAIKFQKQGTQQNPMGVDKVEDIDEWGDVPIWLGDRLGEGLASIGITLLSGGVGKAVGTQVGKYALSNVGQQVAKKLPTGAMVAQSGVSETGATASELREKTGETQTAASLAAGAAKGALESLTPLMLGKALGISGDEVVGLVGKISKLLYGSTKGRVLTAAAKGAGLEGATELTQEGIDLLARELTDEEFKLISGESGSRLLNAAAAGAVVGGTTAGGTSAVLGRVAKEEEIPPGNIPQGDTIVPSATEAQKPDLTGEIAPIEAAITAEEQFIKDSSVTVSDLADGATPGSRPEHASLGFTLLPENLRGLRGRKPRDWAQAPVEVVARDLAQMRNDLGETIKDTDVDPKVKKQVERQLAEINDMHGYLLNAGLNLDSKNVPTAVLTTKDADRMVEEGQLDFANDDLLPHGYRLAVTDNATAPLQLQRVDGKPVLNFPNDINYRNVVARVMKADRQLEVSGFYKIAEENFNKLILMQGEGVDLSYLKSIDKGKRAKELQKALKISTAAEKVPAKERPKVGQAAALVDTQEVNFSRFAEYGYTLLQWADQNPTLTPLHNYKDILQTFKAQAMQGVSRGDALLKRFMWLGKAQQDAAHDFLESLWRMRYRTTDELKDGTVRMPTPDEEAALMGYPKEGDRRLQWLAKQRKGPPLLKETYEVLNDMRRMFDETFNDYTKERATKALEIRNPKTRLATLKGIQKDVEQYYSKPRFPFISIGDFVVSVRDADGKLVRAYQSESRAEQVRDAEELKKKYPADKGYTTREFRMPQSTMKFLATPASLGRELTQQGVLSKLSREQKEVVNYLATSGSGQRRRFITGMSPKKRSVELQRAFALWTQNYHNALFQLKAEPLLRDQINTLKMAAARGNNLNGNKLGLLSAALERHMEYLFNPPPDWAPLKNFAFMWHIGFNMKSAFMNTTQVPLVAFPYLAARFGDGKALLHLQKAYIDKRSFYTKEKVARLSDSMSRLLTEGIEAGKVDESFATELASLAEGTNINRMLAGSKWDRSMKEFAYYGSYLFAAVEKYNRSVTFRAAAQLALNNPDTQYLQELVEQQPLSAERLRAKGFTDDEVKAYLAGVDAIDKTMFEYAKWNRPEFMRGGFKGSIFTFWMFTQGMLHFATHAPGALRYWLIMLSVAGLMGLPGAEDLDELVHAVSQRFFGKDFKPSREARLLIKTLIDPIAVPYLQKMDPGLHTAADLLMHGSSHDGFGLATAFDALGLPFVPKVDLSRSLGMGRVLPVGPELIKPGVDYQRALSETTERVAGAAFGPMFAIMEALRSDNADFKRWESAMPAALRGFLRAGRYQQEGLERGFKNQTILNFDPHDINHQMEIIGVAFGFMPTRLSKKWTQEIATRDAINYWSYRKKALLDQLDYALYMKDPEGKADVLAAIKRFNGQLPEYAAAKRITNKTISQSMKERARRRRAASGGVPNAKQDRPIAEYLKSLYE